MASILSNRGPGTAAGAVGGGMAVMDEPEDPHAGDPLIELLMRDQQPSRPLRVVVDGAGSYGDEVLDAIMR